MYNHLLPNINIIDAPIGNNFSSGTDPLFSTPNSAPQFAPTPTISPLSSAYSRFSPGNSIAPNAWEPVNFNSVNPSYFSSTLPDLAIEFGNIQLPSTINFGDIGQARVFVTNQGNAYARGPLKVDLYISTDGKLDRNDALLTSQFRNIDLAPGQSIEFNLEYRNNTSVIAPGSYQLIARVDPDNQIIEQSENNNILSQLVSAPGTDVVNDWIATALNAIQAEGAAGRGVEPTRGSRLLAIESVAVYDTLNAFTRTHAPYALDLNAPAGASLEAAAVGAAYRVLSTQLPGQVALLDRQLAKSLAEIQDTPQAEAAGLSFGQTVADGILALRANDGSNNNAPYIPPQGNYVWRPDAPDFRVVTPNWGGVTPWAIPSAQAFAPNGLDGTPTNNPELYAREIEEVRRLGGRQNTPLTTITRNPDQTEVAFFWSYDRPDTFGPYGQLNQITQEISIRQGNSLADNARLFAALNTALADAAIVAWDAKFTYTQPRPDDVIAGGIAQNDGLASTVGDPNWRPLLPTPAFPDYISGHSTFAGAWAGVLNQFFGNNYRFSAVSQELPGVIRSYNSFNDAAIEDGLSRIYGGVHVREATITDAVPVGLEIGQFVAQNFFQPTPVPVV